MAARDGAYSVPHTGTGVGAGANAGYELSYTTEDNTRGEILAAGFFDTLDDPPREEHALDMRRALRNAATSRRGGQGCRVDIQASDGRAFDTLYVNAGDALRFRGGGYRLIV